jgi:hypothetical protein
VPQPDAVLAALTHRGVEGEAGSPVAAVSLPALRAAARRAGLEVEEKVVTSSIDTANKTS